MTGFARRLGRFGRPSAPTPEEYARQERSWAELEAGRLPLSAQERLAAESGDRAFASDLGARDLAALRAAGYEPVGQVFGTAVFNRVQLPGLLPTGVHPGLAKWPQPLTVWRDGRLGSPDSFIRNTASPFLVSGFYQAERGARASALRRLELEAKALGADAVIGVRRLTGDSVAGCVEVSLCATAVRSVRRVGDHAYFSTMLPAHEFGPLVQAGWLPVDLVYELARYTAHGGFAPVLGGGRLNPNNYRPMELTASSEIVQGGSGRARQTVADQVRRLAAAGMVLHEFDVQVHHHHCVTYEGATDYTVDLTMTGTAIRPVARRTVPLGPGLHITPVVRLDQNGFP